MADHSKIEWTETTWNPIAGCTHVSPGCDNCYAAREASGRLSGTPTYAGLAEGGKFNGTVRLLPDRLDQPLRWRKPRRVFVNSMSDLFHPDVPDEFIARVFAVMALTPRHTYQILTKRHGRMRSLLSSTARDGFVGAMHDAGLAMRWPLPNVWGGVSVEDQGWATRRIPALVDTPLAVGWLSCEPLLGAVDLGPWLPNLGWVVCGGESGPNARPMHPDWARSLRDQCSAAGVPFFFKQWGEHAPVEVANQATSWTPVEVMERVGKKAAGRELDGRTWDQYPEVRHVD